jgi:opacity protein-like surface antigen
MQFIPALGLSKSTDANAGDAKLSGSVALRAPILPFLSAEGGIAYRQESFSNDDFTVRTWPVTASLWLTPIPMLYAGGGLGWYRTTYDYRSSLPYTDSTTDQVGVHLGGGLAMPLSPSLGLDLNMRYVFMQQDNSLQFPTTFNPDFWSTTLGLAIKF